MKFTIILTISFVLLIPLFVFAQVEPEVEPESVFKIKKQQVLSKLTSHNGIPFEYEFFRDFSASENNAYYQMYKIIDTRNNKHVGDLVFYVGTSEWWDKEALFQQDDTSGYSNIIKVKLFVTHLTEPKRIDDVSNSLSYSLKVLVPEWSSKTSYISSDEWFFDSISNAERNAEDIRENKIIIENKEVRAFNDDIGFGSMSVIVTENYDKTYLNYVSEPDELLEKVFDFSESKETQQMTQSEIIQQQVICGEGTVEKDGICIAESTKLEPKKSDTSFNTQNIGVLIAVGILVIIVIVVMKKIQKKK